MDMSMAKLPEILKTTVIARSRFFAVEEIELEWLLGDRQRPLAPQAERVAHAFYRGCGYSDDSARFVKLLLPMRAAFTLEGREDDGRFRALGSPQRNASSP